MNFQNNFFLQHFAKYMDKDNLKVKSFIVLQFAKKKLEKLLAKKCYWVRKFEIIVIWYENMTKK